jgi:hypothetical protein
VDRNFIPTTLKDFVEYLTKRKKGTHLYTVLGLERGKMEGKVTVAFKPNTICKRCVSLNIIAACFFKIPIF